MDDLPPHARNVMTRSVRPLVLLCAAALVFALLATPSAVAREGKTASLHVLGARIHPLKPKGKAWDADHQQIPLLVYHTVGGATGFPPLPVLSMVPYRNRPDPYVVVLDKELELGRSSAVQGTFLPAWALEVPLPPTGKLPPVLTFKVMDDDLKDDDEVGKALVDTAAMVASPGPHVLEGSAGLHDLTVVVRNPGAEGAGPPVGLHVRGMKLQARDQRPAGGDWDAGGNPLRRRFPRIPFPEALDGLKVVKPDLEVTLDWLAGGTRTEEGDVDSHEFLWEEIGFKVRGRAGIGDGLLVTAVDKDIALADPVGVLYVPFEKFLGARSKGVLVVEGDEENGIEKVEITFSLD